MSDRKSFDFGVWKNDRRESPKHPHLRASKPVEVDGKVYWASVWIRDGHDDNMAERVNAFVDSLADHCGSSPIISISLEPAEARQAPSAAPTGGDDGKAPF